jgi:hypothetical protein
MDHTDTSRASIPSELRIGGMAKADLLAALREHEVQLNEAAKVLFADPRFTTLGEERVVELVAVSVAELGFGEGATYGEIVRRALDVGLVECPLEVGPHLRLKFRAQADSADGRSLTHGRAPPGSLVVCYHRPETDPPTGVKLIHPAARNLRSIGGVVAGLSVDVGFGADA